MSTHNLCFGAKIRKIGIPLHTPVLLYKSGIQGVFITRTCFGDDTELCIPFTMHFNIMFKRKFSQNFNVIRKVKTV